MCTWLQVAPLVMLALTSCGDWSQAARVSDLVQPYPSPPTVERVLLWPPPVQDPPTTRTQIPHSFDFSDHQRRLLRDIHKRRLLREGWEPTWPIRDYWQWERQQRRGPNGFLPTER